MMHFSNFPARIVIASRQSRLALWQAEHVKVSLHALYPSMQIDILGLTTKGDQILDRPLAKVGGKGLFTKELERALEEGRADIAVHSMKDVPMQLADGFCLAAILARENPADALVSNHYASLAELPVGACVGTSSVRRTALVQARFPHLNVRSLRGNLDTRLAKLDAGEFDAILLAAAGLIRLGLGARIRACLPPTDWLSAPGQGALGIEIYNNAVPTWLAALNDAQTAQCVQAERAFSNALNGSCQLPLGAYASLQEQNLHLRGFVASPDGAQFLQDTIDGAANDAQKLGMQLAQKLRTHGATALLEAIVTHE